MNWKASTARSYPATTPGVRSLGTSDEPRATYARRVPEETVLYETVRGQLETFLVRSQTSGRSVPAFVERELHAFLKCGILAHGFVRSLLLDGVYICDMHGSLRFLRLPAPDDAEIERVTRHIVRRLRRLLIRRGLSSDADPTHADPLRGDEPLLADIYAASVRSRTAMAERAGKRLLRIGERIDPEETALRKCPRCTNIDRRERACERLGSRARSPQIGEALPLRCPATDFDPTTLPAQRRSPPLSAEAPLRDGTTHAGTTSDGAGKCVAEEP